MGEVTRVSKQNARVVSLKKGPQGEGFIGCSGGEDKRAVAETFMQHVCFGGDQKKQNEFIKNSNGLYEKSLRQIIAKTGDKGTTASRDDCPDTSSHKKQDCPVTTWCSSTGITKFYSASTISFSMTEEKGKRSSNLATSAFYGADGLDYDTWGWNNSSNAIEIPFKHDDRLVFCKKGNQGLQTAWYGLTIWGKSNSGNDVIICNEFIGAERPNSPDYCKPRGRRRSSGTSDGTATPPPAASKPLETEKPAGNPFEM